METWETPQWKDDIHFILYNGAVVPVIRTRRHKKLARDISYQIFVRGVSRRSELRFNDSVDAERFVSYYLRRLQNAGLIMLDLDGNIQVISNVAERIDFHKRLIELRKKGYSLRQLADRLNVPQKTLESWIYMRTFPRKEDVIRRVMQMEV